MGLISAYQVQTEKTVDRLIDLAEVQYNALSSVTFTYAGRYANVLPIKTRHDQLSYLAYGKARDLNRLVNDRAAAVISVIEKTDVQELSLRQKILKKANQAVSDTTEIAKSSLESSIKRVLG